MSDFLGIRTDMRDAILELKQMEQRMLGWAESLPLPAEADEMWEGRIPITAPATLYAAIEAVRCDCIQEAIERLSLLGNDASLPQQDLWVGENRKGGVTFQELPQLPGKAGRKETPPCSD
jgi:hypothetical protein